MLIWNNPLFPQKSLLPELEIKPTNGLISAYYFSGNARDTINSNHGKVIGATLLADRFGNENSAYSFNGLNNLINLGTGNSLKLEKMTISLWVKINSPSFRAITYVNQPFIHTRATYSDQSFEAYFIGFHSSFQKLDAANSSSTGIQIASVSNTQSKINDWYHVVYMFNTDSSFFYVNDVLQDKKYKGFKSTYLLGDSVNLGYIGNNFTGTGLEIQAWLNGCLDDIRIYNRILSETEIQKLYKEPNPNPYKRKNESQFNLKDWLLNFWYIPLIIAIIIVFTVLITKWRLNFIRQKEEKENKIKQQLSQMEMQALRSQMNPHFIFNALGSIQNYVLNNEKELANKYLVKFSTLMRNVLELSKEELITLKEELETVHLYLEIESLRFDHAFQFTINVAEDVDIKNIKIPPLIIQPFVENAIWHGLLPKKEDKKININVSKKESSIIVEIDDNGIGRKASHKPLELGANKKSLGMEITHSRLKTLVQATGISMVMEIIDKTDPNGIALGTKVVLKIFQTI